MPSARGRGSKTKHAPRPREGSPHTEGSASRHSSRTAQPSVKQVAINKQKDDELSKMIERLQRENARLKQQQAALATRHEEADEEHERDVESEDEQDYIVEKRNFQSAFEARGIFSSPAAPSTKRLRRANDVAEAITPNRPKARETSQATSESDGHATRGQSADNRVPPLLDHDMNVSGEDRECEDRYQSCPPRQA
ncbi:hypothetical protein C8Q76DRAFT_792584 [Earliella scabrosa]|nr:hypothetical protein C8Q76DRAFT_792584 [Earliella scabrosa]